LATVSPARAAIGAAARVNSGRRDQLWGGFGAAGAAGFAAAGFAAGVAALGFGAGAAALGAAPAAAARAALPSGEL
jgi:hypothetical protein